MRGLAKPLLVAALLAASQGKCWAREACSVMDVPRIHQEVEATLAAHGDYSDLLYDWMTRCNSSPPPSAQAAHEVARLLEPPGEARWHASLILYDMGPAAAAALPEIHAAAVDEQLRWNIFVHNAIICTGPCDGHLKALRCLDIRFTTGRRDHALCRDLAFMARDLKTGWRKDLRRH